VLLPVETLVILLYLITRFLWEIVGKSFQMYFVDLCPIEINKVPVKQTMKSNDLLHTLSLHSNSTFPIH